MSTALNVAPPSESQMAYMDSQGTQLEREEPPESFTQCSDVTLTQVLNDEWTDTEDVVIPETQDPDIIPETQENVVKKNKTKKRKVHSFYIAKPTKSRKRFSNMERFEAACWTRDNKPTMQAIMLKFGCQKTVAKTLKSQFEKIIAQHERVVEEGAEHRKSGRGAKFEEVEACLIRWVKHKLARGLPIPGALIKSQAIEFAKKIGCGNECHWTDGWLQKFRLRHGLKSKVIHGEANDAKEDGAASFRSNILPRLLEKYEEKDIFNADETGIMWRMLSNRSYVFAKSRNIRGSKKLKDRLTILVTVNMTGTEKLGLVIGKSKNPLSFRGRTFPSTLEYDYSTKGWMTTVIWEKYLKRINQRMRFQNRKICLLVDNFSGHTDPNCSNIEVVFFPPNTTSILQPCDQGIINSFKCHYRRLMSEKLLDIMDGSEEHMAITQLVKKIAVFDACCMIHRAWDKVTCNTIVNAWKKGGFTSQNFEDEEIACNVINEILNEENEAVNSLGELLQQLLGITVEEALEDAKDVVENGLKEENMEEVEDITDEAIIAEVQAAQKKTEIVIDNDDSEDEDEPPPVTLKEARIALTTFSQWCEENNISFPHHRVYREQIITKQQEVLKQKTIKDYLHIVRK